jgi:signal transduction histidine kinase
MNVLNVLTLSLFAVAVLLAIVTAVSWRYRSAPGAPPFVAFLCGLLVWTLAVAFEAAAGASGDTSAVLFFASLEYLGIGVIPVAWFVFALEYTGREEWVGWPLVTSLSAVPAITLVLAFTHHPALRSVLEPAGIDTHEILGQTFLETHLSFGPWFWLFVAYGYFLLISGSALLLRVVVRAPWLYRTRLLPIVLGLVVPLVLNVVFFLQSPPLPISPTPYAFVLTATLVGWAVFDGELFEHVPIPPGVANRLVVQELESAVFVVDSRTRIVECNPAAIEMSAVDEPRGRTLSTAVSTLLTDDGSIKRGETTLTIDGEQRYYDVNTTDLRTTGDCTVGLLVTLHDVTGQRLREQRLDVLHRILRHNVRQTSNVILGHGSALADELDQPKRSDRAATITQAADRLADWSERAGSLDHALPPLDGNRTELDLVAAVDAAITNVVDQSSNVVVDSDCLRVQWVRAHPSMQEGIEELLENGIRHNHSEHPILDIEIGVTDETVTLEITDNGPGIPEPERAVIERGRETPLEHGSGLGLWLASWSVRASGGELSLRTDSSGTTVSIRLAAARSPTPDDEHGSASGDADTTQPATLNQPAPGHGEDR